MFVVMNRLTAPAEFAGRVEQGFAHSTATMKELTGFVNFRLLKLSADSPNQILYIAETTWQDQPSYEAWRSGDAFARAHGGGGGNSPLTSVLETFEVVHSQE